MKKTLLLFAAGLISAGSFAATLHVDAAGDGETVFRTIGEAAARAQPGDLILTVGAGDIYTAGEALLQ